MQILRKVLKSIPFVLFVSLTQAIQTAGVILIAVLNNAPIQCIFIYVAMIITRNLFGRSYHAKAFLVCTCVTWTIFYFLTASVPPLFVSIYSAAFLGIGTSFFMHKVQMFLEVSDRIKNLDNVFKLEKYCDADILTEICKHKNMTLMETDLLVQHYTKNLSYVKLQEKYNYSERHLKRLVHAAEVKFYN